MVNKRLGGNPPNMLLGRRTALEDFVILAPLIRPPQAVTINGNGTDAGKNG
jgi:hypothetical protein